MNDQNQKINYRYRCKINDVNYNIQLFNIQQEKIKIMIDTKNPYSDDYVEYSNIYSLVQFQEITRYYILFENIEEIFEDLSRTIQQKNFSISHNGNTMTLTIKVIINQKEKDVNFILDKTKIIDLSSQRDNPYFNTMSSKKSDKYRQKYNLEKSKRNIDISSINELNTLLSDFKDRITVLEASQNNQMYINSNQDKIYNDNNINIIGPNDNLNQGLENILLRINKLENDNNYKDKKIEKLEKKLRYYESIENDNNNNNYYKYSVPTYPNTLPKNQMSIYPQYNNNILQSQRQSSLTLNQKGKTNYSTPYFNNKDNQYRLKQSKSEIFNNNENLSLQSKENKKYNNNLRNSNSYIDKKISFRENTKSYGEKDTFRSNKFSYPIDANSSYAKTNNSNLNSTISNYSNLKDKNFQKYLFYKEKLGIPIVAREDLKKYVNSRIIFTKNELRLLKTKLSEGNKKVHVFFDLLYRASIDGDYEEVIQNYVEGKEKTLTLFYTYEGSRFGVYTSTKKAKSFLKGRTYKEIPGTSFIVSLNNLKFFDISYNKTSKQGIEDYLSFGRTYYLNSNGTNWLIYTPKSNFLKHKCTMGKEQGDYIDFDSEILIGNKDEYHIKDIEIFHVVFERDDEEEYDNKKKEKKRKNE